MPLEANVQLVEGAGDTHRAMFTPGHLAWPSCFGPPRDGDTGYRAVASPITCWLCLRYEAYELIRMARIGPDNPNAKPSDPVVFRRIVDELVARDQFDQATADGLCARFCQ
jgi:hypothetical protein